MAAAEFTVGVGRTVGAAAAAGAAYGEYGATLGAAVVGTGAVGTGFTLGVGTAVAPPDKLVRLGFDAAIFCMAGSWAWIWGKNSASTN